MARNGLKRGEQGLQIYVMCEIPANALLADQFLDHFDGFSIGSNDLTQLTLGVDRDSGLVSGVDERNPAVLMLMEMAIEACKRRGKYIGICGQAPSDFPEITRWLVEHGIESILEVLTTLTYAKSGTGHGTKIVLAVPNELTPRTRPTSSRPGTRISTEFVHLTEKHFADLGIDVKVSWSFGATEAKVPEIVDAIVDVTETGSTLRAHGMKIIDTLLTSDPVLVANRDPATDPDKRAAMEDLVTLLRGALEAEGRVLIKLNVSSDHRDSVLAVLPAMKAPTVSSHADGGLAIEAVVDKRGVNRLIPQLKAAGASDILEIPISKIVP